MSKFYITNLPEEQYLDMFKKQRKVFNETGEFPDLDLFYEPDDLGDNGAEIFIESIGGGRGFYLLDDEILDDFQDIPYLKKYFDGEYTLDDIHSGNPSLNLEYSNLCLYMDEKYLKKLLRLVKDNLFKNDNEEFQSQLVELHHILKTAIRYSKDFKFHICCQVFN